MKGSHYSCSFGGLVLSKAKFLFIFLIVALAVRIGIPGAVVHAEVGADRVVQWTQIIIAAGEYADLQTSLTQWCTSYNDQVKTVVLHDPYGVNNSVAYYIQHDTIHGVNTAVNIPLNQIFTNPGQEIAINDKNVLDQFLSYVQSHFPAYHYLLSIRSNEDFYSFVVDRDYPAERDGEDPKSEYRRDDRYEGITIINFEWVMQQFIARQSGRKIDVLHFGFCLSGVIDWMYQMAPYADYYVGTEHNSNPPVTSYWRNYRYIWELCNNPSMTADVLASRIVEIFLSHAYYGYHEDEPATASAINLSQIDAVATAFRNLVDHLTAIMPTHSAEILRAIAETQSFGYYRRCDVKHLMQNFQRYVADAQTVSLAAVAEAAVTAAVIQEKHEHYRDAYGITVPLLIYGHWHSTVGDNYLARFGDFAEDSDFDHFMDALPAPSAPVSGLIITEVDPHPDTVTGTRGDRIEIYNKGASPVDLRGLALDDMDSPRMYAFVNRDDVNNAAAILQPGKFAVISLRRIEANPYTAPAKAEVVAQSYGISIVSYTATQRTVFSNHDDQVILMDRDNVIDAVAWHDANGQANGVEAVNLEWLVNKQAWQGPIDVAMDYFSGNYDGSNDYEHNAINFSYIAASENGSIQRIYDGSYFSEGSLGADSAANFVVCRENNFGDFTPIGQQFVPLATPHLIITEIAPNIPSSAVDGDKIEIFNADSVPVDLYNIVLSDLDPGKNEADLCGTEIQLVSDDIGHDQIMLNPGFMAVVQTILVSLDPQPAPVQTDYGWFLQVQAGDQFESRGDQVVLVNHVGGDLIDSVVYANTDLSGFAPVTAKTDYVLDIDSLTMSNGGLGFLLNAANAWAGSDSQAGHTLDDAFANCVSGAVRFPYAEGAGGSIQRLVSNHAFVEGAPDSPTQFTTSATTNFGVLPATPPATWTPTPFQTPTVTPTSSGSPSSPTTTPTGPTATPTPTGSGVECTILTNQAHYQANDMFLLSTHVVNYGPAATADEYIILDVYGEYWFWPNWTQSLGYETKLLEAGATLDADILTFVWPQGAGAAENINFWIGMLNTGTIDVLCVHYTTFGFS